MASDDGCQPRCKRPLQLVEYDYPEAKRSCNEDMASQIRHFRLRGSPKRKNFTPKRRLQMQQPSKKNNSSESSGKQQLHNSCTAKNIQTFL